MSAIRKRKRARQSSGYTAPASVKVHPDDVLWWASINGTPMFTEAAKEVRAQGKHNVEVLWPRGASKLIVRPLSVTTGAVRKRNRRAK